MPSLTNAIKTEAHRLGFDICRITPVTTAPHGDFFADWLAQGRAGEMTYLARHVEKRREPHLLAEPGAPTPHSLIVLAVDYHQADLPASVRDDPSRGLIAAYAWGDDYHELIRPLLYELDAFIRRQSGRTTQAKCLVDTGPVLERDWAQVAGIGFTGKNCCTIDVRAGSWLFLATMLVPERLAYDPAPQLVAWPATGRPGSDQTPAWNFAPPVAPADENPRPRIGTCGHCTRCLAACPTDAFVGPYHLDPLKCISYWTIEAGGPIPPTLRPAFGNRIFGCDICQEVCPWNQRLAERAPRLAALTAQAGRVAPPLLEGFAPENPYWLDDAAFRTRFRRSPILRAKRRGMLRNVCVALGNWAAPVTVPPLRQALRDTEPLARAHAAWALGSVIRRQHEAGTAPSVIADAIGALRAAQQTEPVGWVAAEIATALA